MLGLLDPDTAFNRLGWEKRCTHDLLQLQQLGTFLGPAMLENRPDGRTGTSNWSKSPLANP